MTTPEPTTPGPGIPPAPPTPDHGRAGRNLPAAITVGVLLAAALFVTLGWFPLGFQILVALALALGAVEVHNALKRLDMHSAIVPIVIGTVAIVTSAYFAGQRDLGISANTLMLAMIGITALATLIWRMPKGEQGYVRDAAASMFIIGYIPLLGSFVGLMLADDLGRMRVITFISVVALGDLGGYVAGVLFGKHKMAPRISPKKTWEGFAGSILFGVVGAILFVVYGLHAPFWVGIILGAMLVIVGACGDLIESLIKRDVGIKDMSSFLPGHGGVMDRLDSLLVAAPVAWFLMVLLIPGGGA
ncbi:MAG TPA: phosphatidate cytidylyltransferase [Propionibacterium sp.]|jgi:phosphatidate cytidylyltransferase|nr:phosphatidate cytidylyltransferase [Propionibacterium sp.]